MPGTYDRRPALLFFVATSVAVVSQVLPTSASAPAWAQPRPTPCDAARYIVRGAPLGGGPAGSPSIDVGGRVALGAACAGVEPDELRSNRSGAARLRARWAACAGFDGPVTLKARIVGGCSRLNGTLRAGKFRRKIKADRSECADGVVGLTAMENAFTPTRQSLATHALPAWFADAKFGIMIHWGIFTIPAWAETVIDPADWLGDLNKLLAPPDYGREWFVHIPYAEWYPNTILIDGSPAQAHHRATYGAEFAYEEFRPAFDAASAAFSAAPWADLFKQAGARYVVLVTKHHDGFALWPTDVPHPRRPGWHASRDFVGELTAAVRARCMRMGLYYSGGLDWSVQPGPIANTLDLARVLPQSPEYIAYADGQWRELIARYRPAVLWNDIGYPNAADELALFADYYNEIPDGLVNDRFGILPGLTHQDYVTPEFSVVRGISPGKFETVRGMGHGFGYNRNETDYDSAATLIHLLADVVSKNGNLLLNVGPYSDGTIPPPQIERLRAIGGWLDVNGEAIYATRPWTRAEGMTADGTPVRFTARGDDTVYAIVLGPPTGESVTLNGLEIAPTRVRLLGLPGDRSWTRVGADLRVALPPSPTPAPAHVIAIDVQ